MKDRNGNSLNITSMDTVTISFVREGKTYSTSVSASDSLSTLIGKANNEATRLGDKPAFSTDIRSNSYIGKDVAGDTVGTADGGSALTIQAAGSGVTNQLSGVTISVTNTKGQVQKSANAVLDNFSESIRAQNKSTDNSIVLQVGTKANQSIKVGLTDMRAEALGLQSSSGANIQIGTQKQANAAINVLDNAVQKALDQQTTIGSVESRLEYTSANLTTASENVQSSESTIRDANMAKEMTEYTKNNVLMQAAQSMLAQANQSSSSVLSLLQ
jgi:flagellin